MNLKEAAWPDFPFGQSKACSSNTKLIPIRFYAVLCFRKCWKIKPINVLILWQNIKVPTYRMTISPEPAAPLGFASAHCVAACPTATTLPASFSLKKGPLYSPGQHQQQTDKVWDQLDEQSRAFRGEDVRYFPQRLEETKNRAKSEWILDTQKV